MFPTACPEDGAPHDTATRLNLRGGLIVTPGTLGFLNKYALSPLYPTDLISICNVKLDVQVILKSQTILYMELFVDS